MSVTKDDANILALEGFIVAILIFGVLYSAVNLEQEPSGSAMPRRALESDVTDALRILEVLTDANGSLLNTYLAEALDCASGERPSASGCDKTRPANLSLRLDGYLPLGTEYSISLDNGLEPREIYKSSVPAGERVSASKAFTPSWNLTYIVTDFSCHSPGVTVNTTLIPIWQGELVTPSTFGVNVSGSVTTASTTPTAGVWNATLAPSAVGAMLAAEATGARGTLNGTASTTACDLGGNAWTVRDALNQSTSHVVSTLGTTTAPIGSALTIRYDFTTFSTMIPGATLTNVSARVYDPVGSRANVPESYVLADRFELGTAWSGEANWSVPVDSLFGTHPVVVVAYLTVPGATGKVDIEARLATHATVALRSGVVPLNAPYRVVLEAWLPDWR